MMNFDDDDYDEDDDDDDTRGGATTGRHDNRKTVATHGGMSRLRTFTSNDWWPRPRVSRSVSGEMFFLFTCQFSPLCA